MDEQDRAVTVRRFRRTTGDDRRVAGVAGGIARALGVDPVVVRFVFVLLTVTSGIGIVAYLLALFVPADDDVPAPGPRRSRRDVERVLGAAMIAVGLAVGGARLGLGLPPGILWPVAIVAAGATVAWSRLDRRPGDLLDGGRAVVARIVAGSVLLAAGIGTFVALNERIVVASQIVLAVLAAATGVVLLAGPWIVRLGRQLADERTERIRADERAEMAAHLHDSVLQTLAMIQRRAESPAETVALARRQERELRAWLHGGDADPASAGGTLAAGLQAVADEVEAAHAAVVEVVVVGDAPLDEALAAVVAAVREAAFNAARHSGAGAVAVYAEVDDDEVVAFVRDRGCGFDPATVPADRRGLADSVRGRLARAGGEAQITSAPGAGTEVAMRLPHRSVVA